jgi:hypothetical protein
LETLGNVTSVEKTESIKDRQFDTPLYVAGEISGEPERYLAEKPYELSKFEFSVLKKGKFRSNTLFHLVSGATIGLILTILGKTLNALVQKQTPTLESWELWSLGAGIALAVITRVGYKTEDEKEFDEIRKYINQHFEESPRRRVHRAGREEKQK